MSSAEIPLPDEPIEPGSRFLAGDPRAAGRAPPPARARGGVRARRGRDPRARRDDDPHGRARIVRQRGVVRRLRVRPPATLDGASRLDLAHRLLRRRAGHVGLHGARTLAVGPDTGRRRVRDARASDAARTPSRSRTTRRRSSHARPTPSSSSRAGPEHAVAATKTYSNQVAALGLLAAHAAERRCDAFADGCASGRRSDARSSRRAVEARIAEGRDAVRLRRPHVRRRTRRRVRDRTRDRAQAARDVPDRRGAAHRDGPRARAGRRARLALPRLGNRVRRRDAPRRRRGRRACARGRCDDHRERQCGRVDSRRGLHPRRAPSTSLRSSLRCCRSFPASSSRGRSRARGGSIRTRLAGCRR